MLLRGVNVGGHNRIAMAAFRSALESVGCTDVATYLQSGNAGGSWPGSAAALRDAVVGVLELPVAVLVVGEAELDAVIARCPFAEADLDPTLLHVVFLEETLDTALLPEPSSLLPDRLAVADGALYVRYAGSSHDSKVAKLLGSKRFPVASARNWRTVLALQELVRR